MKWNTNHIGKRTINQQYIYIYIYLIFSVYTDLKHIQQCATQVVKLSDEHASLESMLQICANAPFLVHTSPTEKN